MADKVTNELLLEQLKSIQARLTNLESGMSDVKTSLIGIQQHMEDAMATDEDAEDGTIALIDALGAAAETLKESLPSYRRSSVYAYEDLKVPEDFTDT